MPRVIDRQVFCPEKKTNRSSRECLGCDRLKKIDLREGGKVECRPKSNIRRAV